MWQQLFKSYIIIIIIIIMHVINITHLVWTQQRKQGSSYSHKSTSLPHRYFHWKTFTTIVIIQKTHWGRMRVPDLRSIDRKQRERCWRGVPALACDKIILHAAMYLPLHTNWCLLVCLCVREYWVPDCNRRDVRPAARRLHHWRKVTRKRFRAKEDEDF